METIFAFLIPIFILLLLLRWMLGRFISKDTFSDYVAAILHSMTLGIWHWIFGPPKRRIVRGAPRK